MTTDPTFVEDSVRRNREQFALAAGYYDEQFADRTEDVDFWVARAAELGGPVLEAGCGTGRILVPVAAAGHAAVGIDHSAEMLDRARAAAARAGRHLSLHEADLRDPPAAVRGVRQVFFTFGVLQYVLAGQVQTLRRYRELVSPDGRILVDVKAFYEDAKYLAAIDRDVTGAPEEFVRSGRRLRVVPHLRWDSTDQVIVERYRHQVLVDGAVVEEYTTEHAMRSYSLPELRLIAEGAGLRVGHVWRSYVSDRATTGRRYVLELLP